MGICLDAPHVRSLTAHYARCTTPWRLTLFAVVELAGFPRFLSDTAPEDRPGLEERCHAATIRFHTEHVPHLGADWDRNWPPPRKGRLEGRVAYRTDPLLLVPPSRTTVIYACDPVRCGLLRRPAGHHLRLAILGAVVVVAGIRSIGSAPTRRQRTV
jgi:hypothetical protein